MEIEKRKTIAKNTKHNEQRSVGDKEGTGKDKK